MYLLLGMHSATPAKALSFALDGQACTVDLQIPSTDITLKKVIIYILFFFYCYFCCYYYYLLPSSSLKILPLCYDVLVLLLLNIIYY